MATNLAVRLDTIEEALNAPQASTEAAAATAPTATAPTAMPTAAPDAPAREEAARELPAVSIVGLGYVGAVSTACLASLGHRVVGVDIDAGKVESIASGHAPIHEAELGELLEAGVADGLVSATTDLADAVAATDVTFVSVGTPTAEDGGCDYRAIIASARAIGEGLTRKQGFHVVVMRCSIPPGTTMGVMVPEIEAVSGLKAGRDFGVCFNPEFLREGVAVADFREPPKTVIGATDERAGAIVAGMYTPVDPNPIVTSIEVAEMVKYVDNVWHAAKVCFGNEIGRLCKPLGIDSHKVMDVFCKDTKLNLSPYYLKPGFAFGGSCLPKEVRAVNHIAAELGQDLPLIEALIPSNEVQIARAVEMVRATGAKRVGILGLAFKPGTDDLRESPILEVIAKLREEGIEVMAFDPAVSERTNVRAQLDYVRHSGSSLADLADTLPDLIRHSADEVADWADALVVTQALPAFRTLSVRYGHARIVDLCRLFDTAPSWLSVDGIGW